MAERNPQNTKKRRLCHETIPDSHVSKCRPGLVAGDSLTLRGTSSSLQSNNGGGDDLRIRPTAQENNTSTDSSEQGDGEGREISSTSSTAAAAAADDDDDDDASSQDSDSGSADDVDEVPTLSITRKPRISPPSQVSDLGSRLASFLPQLRQANADLLESDTTAWRRLDQVDDDEEHYIEMNLGLGVLKEKRAGASRDGVRLIADPSTDSDSDSDSDPDSDSDKVEPGGDNGENFATRIAPTDSMRRKLPFTKYSGIDEIKGT